MSTEENEMKGVVHTNKEPRFSVDGEEPEVRLKNTTILCRPEQ